MNTPLHLSFNPLLSFRVVERITGFIHQMDEFATALHPSRSQPLSADFHPLLMGEVPADSEEGYRLLSIFQKRCEAEGYKVTKNDVSNLLKYILAIIMHCAAEALHAEDDDEAYALLSDGRHLHGYATCLVRNGHEAVLRQEFAQKGGEANRDAFQPRKAKIFDWCEENFHKYRSVSAAAQVASLVVPMATKTAVNCINEWRKTKG